MLKVLLGHLTLVNEFKIVFYIQNALEIVFLNF